MADVRLTADTDLDDVIQLATDLNMTTVQTLDMLSGALALARTRRRRNFRYSDPVEEAAPAHWQSAFQRTFQHDDWFDGESVVQAEESAMELGFNARFHRIEADLDALGADVNRVYLALAEQRAEVSRALDEVKLELNRLNEDVFECCEEEDGPPVYTPVPTPGTGPVLIPGGPWEPYDPRPIPRPVDPYGPVIGGPAGPWTINPGLYDPSRGPAVPWGPGETDPVRAYLDGVRGTASFAGAETLVMRSNKDPSRAAIAGMSAKLIEQSAFNGQQVEVWSTAAGIVLTPLAAGAAGGGAGGGGRAAWTNPRVEATTRFAAWAAENEAAAAERLGDAYTVGDLVKAFGEEKLTGGVALSDLLEGFATGQRIKSPMELAPGLAEASAKAIVREGVASETVIGAVGLNAGADGGLGAVRLTALKTLDEGASKAAQAAGLKTVGALAAANPAQIVRAAKQAGVNLGMGEAAGMVAGAASLAAVDRIARGG